MSSHLSVSSGLHIAFLFPYSLGAPLFIFRYNGKRKGEVPRYAPAADPGGLSRTKFVSQCLLAQQVPLSKIYIGDVKFGSGGFPLILRLRTVETKTTVTISSSAKNGAQLALYNVALVMPSQETH